jgi:glycosyltransferase involved in cell wall biosynthesis
MDTEVDRGDDASDARGEGVAAAYPQVMTADALQPVPLEPLPPEPLVSVLVPNKDYGRFLTEALESIRAQTYGNIEVIICDDGSSDDSVDVATSFVEADPRFSLERHEVNRGQGAGFNTAFGRARGEIVAFLDADDTFEPGKLAAVVHALRSGQFGAVVHPLMVTDAEGEPIQRIPALTRFEDGWLGPRVLRRGGRWRWVPTSGIAMRREVADLVFPMPEEGFSSSADTFFLMLVPLLTPIASVDEVLGTYRRHGANVYARAQLDPERTDRLIGNLRLSVDEVNARLRALGHDDVALNLERNLKYRELVFQAALFDEGIGRRSLWRRFRPLSSAFAGDDLYGALQRRWARVMYLVAIGVPRQMRVPWLSASLSASTAKDLVRRAVLRRAGPRSTGGTTEPTP